MHISTLRVLSFCSVILPPIPLARYRCAKLLHWDRQNLRTRYRASGSLSTPMINLLSTSPTPPTPTIHHTHTKCTMSIIYHHNLTSQPPLHNRELLLSECPRHQGRGIDAPDISHKPPKTTPAQSSSHRRAATINTQSFVNYTR